MSWRKASLGRQVLHLFCLAPLRACVQLPGFQFALVSICLAGVGPSTIPYATSDDGLIHGAFAASTGTVPRKHCRWSCSGAETRAALQGLGHPRFPTPLLDDGPILDFNPAQVRCSDPCKPARHGLWRFSGQSVWVQEDGCMILPSTLRAPQRYFNNFAQRGFPQCARLQH
eukprot:gb/GFBE01061984.1/.p1 GENE.gb/GFBE01061984.1/~~gb/GFBE01061984.1/.p1  ORF type:complete len:171 (+),score=7.05 gb/GFBE01061984.1/:1-513(+)